MVLEHSREWLFLTWGNIVGYALEGVVDLTNRPHPSVCSWCGGVDCHWTHLPEPARSLQPVDVDRLYLELKVPYVAI